MTAPWDPWSALPCQGCIGRGLCQKRQYPWRRTMGRYPTPDPYMNSLQSGDNRSEAASVSCKQGNASRRSGYTRRKAPCPKDRPARTRMVPYRKDCISQAHGCPWDGSWRNASPQCRRPSLREPSGNPSAPGSRTSHRHQAPLHTCLVPVAMRRL